MTSSGLQSHLCRTILVIAAVSVVIIAYRRLYAEPEVVLLVSSDRRTMSGEVSGELTVNGALIKYVSAKGSGGGSGGRSVLLLHGARFNLQNWIDINTIRTVAGWGIDVTAVTLHAYPGYGNVKAKETNAAFLADLVLQLGLTRPVIVSPSASGSLSLPYLLGAGGTAADTAGERASGFVAVAPVATHEYPADAYGQLKIPVCSVYGDKDAMAASVQAMLKNVASLRDEPISGAGHACYLDSPEHWHVILRRFLADTVGWANVMKD